MWTQNQLPRTGSGLSSTGDTYGNVAGLIEAGGRCRNCHAGMVCVCSDLFCPVLLAAAFTSGAGNQGYLNVTAVFGGKIDGAFTLYVTR